eukprot:COSAG02_NODE_7_length_64539_cov_120.393482_40_plen_99_part_00
MIDLQLSSGSARGRRPARARGSADDSRPASGVAPVAAAAPRRAAPVARELADLLAAALRVLGGGATCPSSPRPTLPSSYPPHGLSIALSQRLLPAPVV